MIGLVARYSTVKNGRRGKIALRKVHFRRLVTLTVTGVSRNDFKGKLVRRIRKIPGVLWASKAEHLAEGTWLVKGILHKKRWRPLVREVRSTLD
jgi:hypothetical protein